MPAVDAPSRAADETARFRRLLTSAPWTAAPICEVGRAVLTPALGGVAVLPWRAEALAAGAQGLEVAPDLDALSVPLAGFEQALVHADKSREATLCQLAWLWNRLSPGAHLGLCGGNELGIRTTAERAAALLGAMPELERVKAKARLVRFVRGDQGLAAHQAAASFEGPSVGGAAGGRFRSLPGTFAAGRLDAGSALLWRTVERRVAEAVRPTPGCVLDLACGVGVLGLSALLRWPRARAEFYDADARAVRLCRENAEHLGCAGRARVHWWDAQLEPLPQPPSAAATLVLINPPFHRGKARDLGAAEAIFERLGSLIGAGAEAFIVANYKLPYEAPLARLGKLQTLASEDGFKVLHVAPE